MLDKEVLYNLYKKAQEQARIDYNEAHGFDNNDHWHWEEDADKYEREDYVDAAFKRLEKEYKEKNMKQNNTNKTGKELRMEILASAGIDTSKYFNLNLSNIPCGVPVRVEVGKMKYDLTPSIPNEIDYNDWDHLDRIVDDILNNGYVFNRKTDGRFITAQTFRMLNTPVYNLNTNKDKPDWNLYLKHNYSYMYQFDMMKDELKRLAKMERDKDPEFERLSCFFTKNVVISTCENYVKKLEKHISTLKRHNHKKRPYIKLKNYGMVYTDEIYKLYNPLNNAIYAMKNANNYSNLHGFYMLFYRKLIDLPYETPKYCMWKDAFKGKGAYVTLLNIIKFHGVKIHYKPKYFNEEKELNTYESVNFVNDLLKTYKGEYWRFHMLLVKTIKDNNFDLKESIENNK